MTGIKTDKISIEDLREIFSIVSNRKQMEISDKPFLVSVGVSIPHPKKLERHGEDSHMLLSNAVAVFDGVSGSRKWNVDPGVYARGLSRILRKNISQNNCKSIYHGLIHAVSHNKEKGSSTICAAMLHESMLEIVNVGDSGLILIRDSRIVYRTKNRMRSKECPLQVSYENPKDLIRADRKKFNVKDGDIIILGSDGVFDNVYDEYILNVVSKLTKNEKETGKKIEKDLLNKSLFKGSIISSFSEKRFLDRDPPRSALMTEDLAFNIAKRACDVSLKKASFSPFSPDKKGGKKDDITVIVSMVVSNGENYFCSHECKCPGCDWAYDDNDN